MTDVEHQEPRDESEQPVEVRTSRASRVGLRVSLYCLTIITVVFVLHFAKTLLMPFVVALFFALLLNPAVSWLKQYHIPRAISAIILLCLFGVPFVLLSIELAEPAQKWMGKLPELTTQVTASLTDISDSLTPDVPPPAEPLPEHERGFSFSRFFHDGDDVAATAPDAEPPPESALVAGVKENGIAILLSMLGAAPFIVAQCVVWLILVLFLLIFGPGLYDNSINLVPQISDKRRAVLLVGRLQQQLSRYILTVTIINAALGSITSLALWALGVEDAILWGVLVGLLNYAPFVGPIISIAILCIAGTVQYGVGVSALLPAAVFFGLHLLESQFVTPTILGRHMHLNPLILVLWLLVWGWLWGPIGVLIAVPLLVLLKLVAAQWHVLNYWVELIET